MAINLNIGKLKTGFHKQYQYVKPIDCGRFGQVHLAEKIDKSFFTRHHYVAVKELPGYRHDIQAYNNFQMITNEITNMRKLKGCPNIVKLIDVYNDNNIFYLVQEHCNNNQVKDMLETTNHPYTVSKIAAHIANGLVYCHEKGICHSDIKPSNIMYSPDESQYKIGDFGSSFPSDRTTGSTSIKGTPAFFSLEKFSGTYGYSSDIWALGVLVYYLIFNAHPFMKDKEISYNTTPYDIYTSVASNKIIWHETNPHITPDAIDFIYCTLEKDEKKRMSAHDAIMHPYIKNLILCSADL